MTHQKMTTRTMDTMPVCRVRNHKNFIQVINRSSAQLAIKSSLGERRSPLRRVPNHACIEDATTDRMLSEAVAKRV